MPEWKWRRRVMMPSFNTDKLKTYSHVLYERSRLKLEELQRWADTDEVFDLWNFMSATAFDAVTGE